jgi:hypothetical protein
MRQQIEAAVSDALNASRREGAARTSGRGPISGAPFGADEDEDGAADEDDDVSEEALLFGEGSSLDELEAALERQAGAARQQLAGAS